MKPSLIASVLAACVAAVLLQACARETRLSPVLDQRPCMQVEAVQGAGIPDDTIDWIGPRDPHERRSLAAWCRTLGPAVVVGPAAPPGPADAVAIVGWNVHVGGGDIEALVAALRKGRLTSGVPVPHVVLALQEAYRASVLVPDLEGSSPPVPRAITPPGRHDDIVATAARLGLALYYVPSMRNGRGSPAAAREDRGNALLSSLPLSQLQAIELPLERQRRVAIAATISAIGPSGAAWSLRIVNVHLDAFAGPDNLWVGGPRARSRQAASLARALPSDGPLVLAGDLNAWGGPGEEAVQVLARAFPGNDADERPTFRRQRLDYLFHRLPSEWHARAVRLDERFGSDHYPLLAIVRASR